MKPPSSQQESEEEEEMSFMCQSGHCLSPSHHSTHRLPRRSIISCCHHANSNSSRFPSLSCDSQDDYRDCLSLPSIVITNGQREVEDLITSYVKKRMITTYNRISYHHPFRLVNDKGDDHVCRKSLQYRRWSSLFLVTVFLSISLLSSCLCQQQPHPATNLRRSYHYHPHPSDYLSHPHIRHPSGYPSPRRHPFTPSRRYPPSYRNHPDIPPPNSHRSPYLSPEFGERNSYRASYHSPPPDSISSSSSMSDRYATASFSPSVVRHPGTCTYQRSQPACTFSLLCYLAGGIPVEGCEGDVGLTCCVLSSTGPSFPSPAMGPSYSTDSLSPPSHGPPPPPPPPIEFHDHPPSTSHHYYPPSDYNNSNGGRSEDNSSSIGILPNLPPGDPPLSPSSSYQPSMSPSSGGLSGLSSSSSSNHHPPRYPSPSYLHQATSTSANNQNQQDFSSLASPPAQVNPASVVKNPPMTEFSYEKQAGHHSVSHLPPPTPSNYGSHDVRDIPGDAKDIPSPGLTIANQAISVQNPMVHKYPHLPVPVSSVTSGDQGVSTDIPNNVVASPSSLASPTSVQTPSLSTNSLFDLDDLNVRRSIPSPSSINGLDGHDKLSEFVAPRGRNLAFGEDVCGRPTAKPRSRIIGGQDAFFGEFPWQVHIKIAKHQCGGALVNREFVVTAAHCVYQAPLHQLSIIIGAHDIEDHRFQEESPQYFSVAEVRLHPNFRFSASHPDRFDVAVLKLDKPAKYSSNVLPVCLPPPGVSFEGWYGVVTGWGKTDPALSNRYGTRLLQKVDVPIIKNNECESWHQTRGIDLKIFPEMFCAGYEDGRKDACVGDSGGPLVVFLNNRWTLAGITSAGFGCAQSRQPGIYHRLPVTVDWVHANINS